MKTEVAESPAIITGEVLRTKLLREDAADPAGITASVYTIQCLQTLKGRVPRQIDIRSDNTSSRYPMENGRTYLLFLRYDERVFYVDSCGSSTELPAGERVLTRTRGLLQIRHAEP